VQIYATAVHAAEYAVCYITHIRTGSVHRNRARKAYPSLTLRSDVMCIWYFQDVKTTRMLSGFGTLVPDECIVIRDGCPVQVLSKDLVIGDLVVLQTGAKVPSDIRAVTSHNLRVDKSLLTGEAEPCKVIQLCLYD
jgi:magnesium-transporting ATPase (P-type)